METHEAFIVVVVIVFSLMYVIKLCGSDQELRDRWKSIQFLEEAVKNKEDVDKLVDDLNKLQFRINEHSSRERQAYLAGRIEQLEEHKKESDAN